MGYADVIRRPAHAAGGGCYLEVGSISPVNVFSYDATALVRATRGWWPRRTTPRGPRAVALVHERNLTRFPFEKVISHVFPLERISSLRAGDWRSAAATRRRLPRAISM